MLKTVELEVAQATLTELVAGLKPEDEVLIVKDHQPVARLVATPTQLQPRVPGLLRGKLSVLADDEQHLRDFEDYMS